MYYYQSAIYCRPIETDDGAKETVFGTLTHEIEILWGDGEAIVINRGYNQIILVKADSDWEAAKKYIDYLYGKSSLWVYNAEEKVYEETSDTVQTSEWYKYDYLTPSWELVEER